MDATRDSRRGPCPRRFGDVSPSPAADEELTWFFNGAEAAIDMPSNYCRLLEGVSATSLEEVERRIEALHSAGKINARLQALQAKDAVVLSALYTERPMPDAIVRVLGDLAGAVEGSPTVRAQHLRAVFRGETAAKTVTHWLEELLRARGPRVLRAWRHDVEQECAVAVRAYELARGDGPSVVPEEEL